MAKNAKTQVACCPNPKCVKAIWDDHPYGWCMHCGDPFPDEIKAKIPKLQEEIRRAAENELDKQRAERLLQASQKVVVTTTHNIDGYRVRQYLGVESVEVVIGTGVFSEIASEFADYFGARSSAFEKKLADAKQLAMRVLKCRAAEKGANAVVGVDLDYTEFSGNRVALIVNGTLVAVVPITSS